MARALKVYTELFEFDRMVDALNRDTKAEPEQILKNVRTAVDEFVMVLTSSILSLVPPAVITIFIAFARSFQSLI